MPGTGQHARSALGKLRLVAVTTNKGKLTIVCAAGMWCEQVSCIAWKSLQNASGRGGLYPQVLRERRQGWLSAGKTEYVKSKNTQVRKHVLCASVPL